ncbi:MAG TPA: RNA methyltransferase [Bacteroidales bacterium]|nr:RNA methyltransferase [Bacteroidales bacterium]HPI69471.1 RNA methyltransferase [Bacteroidales bacterium]HPR73730.1 RNA methyltransferase [Bacteroidales bacterium]
MISKSKAGFIVSLQKKKVREEEKLYVIEGDKLVKEYIASKAKIKTIIAKPEFIQALPAGLKLPPEEIIPVSYDELKKISSLKTPHNALAVVQIPDISSGFAKYDEGISAALDSVQDPGNLGTIIRAAAWFGIKNIYCSENCVDVYNPKVIQASMGALIHVRVFYTDIRKFLIGAAEKNIRIYGATLDGTSIYSAKTDSKGIIFLGNESRGISKKLLPLITDRISIPGPSVKLPGIDSLNVGMAASIIFSEFTRNKGE